MTEALIIAIPLMALVFELNRLTTLFSKGKVTITNQIDVTIRHPKDTGVTLPGYTEQPKA